MKKNVIQIEKQIVDFMSNENKTTYYLKTTEISSIIFNKNKQKINYVSKDLNSINWKDLTVLKNLLALIINNL